MGKRKQVRLVARLAQLITNRSERLSSQANLSPVNSFKLTQEIKTYCYLIQIFQES